MIIIRIQGPSGREFVCTLDDAAYTNNQADIEALKEDLRKSFGAPALQAVTNSYHFRKVSQLDAAVRERFNVPARECFGAWVVGFLGNVRVIDTPVDSGIEGVTDFWERHLRTGGMTLDWHHEREPVHSPAADGAFWACRIKALIKFHPSLLQNELESAGWPKGTILRMTKVTVKPIYEKGDWHDAYMED